MKKPIYLSILLMTMSMTIGSCGQNKMEKEALRDSLYFDSLDRAQDSIRRTWTHEDSVEAEREAKRIDEAVKAEALKKYNKEHGIKEKPVDKEGDGKVYMGDYSYPNVKTVKINGKWYDVAIDEYEFYLRQRLPKPDKEVENSVGKVLFYNNYALQIWLKGDQVYDVVVSK